MLTLSWLVPLASGWLLLANAALFWVLRRPLLALWQEPVLRAPVVIFESDDWGAGPIEQVECLQRLREILSRHCDLYGRHPVMTLGLTLARPEVAVRADGSIAYRRMMLDHPEQLPILNEIRQGILEGVFSAQLHGMEHFMPSILCDEARRDNRVRDWLLKGHAYTELLPDRLQSRWIDARDLPSSEHASAIIEESVAEEVSAFGRIFGSTPQVVVPPTFVWTQKVEQAWVRHGVRFLVTCGRRFVARDRDGKPKADGTVFRNGNVSSGLVCLVRDAYFEPVRGHRAGDALRALRSYVDCGRPLLLETHRSNVTTLNAHAHQAYDELDRAVGEMLHVCPQIRFMSTQELGEAFVTCNPEIVETSLRMRLQAWVHRADLLSSFRRYSSLSGGRVILWLLLRRK